MNIANGNHQVGDSPGSDTSKTNDDVATIQAMRQQEETAYEIPNYLQQEWSGDMDVDWTGPQNEPIDGECRFRMSEWCFQIVDFCSFKRETVSIAMSCLDRFVASPGGRESYLNRQSFQLAAMVALYTAIKIHEHEAMDPPLVAQLSRGAFQPEQIEEMESKMLQAIEFRVNPPTALSFVHRFVDLIPLDVIGTDVREAIIDVAKFQTEVAVSDAELVCVNPSSIALAALMNAFDSLDMDLELQAYLMGGLSDSTKIDCLSPAFRDVRIGLYEAITGQSEKKFCSTITPQAASPGSFAKPNTSTFYEESPRSVAE